MCVCVCVCVCARAGVRVCVFFIKLKTRDYDYDDDDSDDGHSVQFIRLLLMCWLTSHMTDYRDGTETYKNILQITTHN